MLFFKTAIFDLDGTLLNTLSDLTDAVNHTLQDFGYPPRTEGEIRRFLGNGSKHLLTKSLPEGTPPEQIETVHAQYLIWYDAHAAIKTAPYEGIPELLDALREQGVSLAVISNKGDAQVKALAKKHFPQISLAVGERPGIRRKPHPDSVFEIMKELNADPDTTLFVGDSEVDLQTAKNAGVIPVAVGWGFREKEELTPYSPKLFLEHPLDLLRVKSGD
ncbi:MAG: HAD family hydrolase [Clostridia bacterium]|nr:HAD family hydrolase [Clostridia bacterium]